jgi:hypothetical protein
MCSAGILILSLYILIECNEIPSLKPQLICKYLVLAFS